MIIEFIIKFLCGIAIFLLGMKIMGEGLEKASSNKIRKIFGKISNNRVVGLGVGTGVTAIIHSSTATTVMAVGLVNAGVMTMFQATNIIMGANIGTTITGLMIALDSLDMSLYMTIPAFIGIFMMLFFKKEGLKKAGTIIAGMGIIFVGLSMMSGAVKIISGEEWFFNMFNTVSNPILLMLIGILVTAIIQSSTAVNAIIIVLVGVSGGLDVVDGLYIILGTNVGTCVTALFASVGTTTSAKRVAIFHLLFNVIGTVVFAIGFMLVNKNAIGKFMSSAFGPIPEFQIAWFNFFQNLICALLLLPFSKQLVKLTTILVPDKPIDKTSELKYVDTRYLVTPSVAISQVIKEVSAMYQLSFETYKLSILSLIELDNNNINAVKNNEKTINKINVGVTDYLVKISSSSSLNISDEELVANLFHMVSDIKRISDHSVNLTEYTTQLLDNNIFFSQPAINELKEMNSKILEMLDLCYEIYYSKQDYLSKVILIEEIVDNMKNEYSTNHIKRLNEEKCTSENGMIFYGALTDLERIADHIMNIAERFGVKNIRSVKVKTKVI